MLKDHNTSILLIPVCNTMKYTNIDREKEKEREKEKKREERNRKSFNGRFSLLAVFAGLDYSGTRNTNVPISQLNPPVFLLFSLFEFHCLYHTSSMEALGSNNTGHKKRVAYFYDAEIGNYHYGQGHPMKVR
jgi:hypothetical protein